MKNRKAKETENKKKEIEESKEKLATAKFIAPPNACKVPCLSNNIKGEQKRVNEAYVKFLNQKRNRQSSGQSKFYLDLTRSYEHLIEENVDVTDYPSYKKSVKMRSKM